jgi:hypothetical protein
MLQWLRVGTLGFVVVRRPLPVDSRIVAARVDADGHHIELVIESKEFPELEPTEDIPWLDAPCCSPRAFSAELLSLGRIDN